jgi:hypothetical protein
MAIDTEKFPSDPTEYEFSGHFTESVMTEDKRHLEWDKVLGTIRHGNVHAADGNADVEWMRDYKGVKCYILCGYNSKKDVPVVITGWNAVHDPRQAIESGRWTENELRDINNFNGGTSLESDFCFP